MFRRIISLLCAVSMLLLLSMFFVSVSAEETAVRSRKIVSVVYDDSGSMKGDRWVYANYATQALIALLDTSDELYLTYMSNPSKAQKQSLNDIEKVVTDMRRWSRTTNTTPGKSLDTAKETLSQVSTADSSAQFWLVVMTDGAIAMDKGVTLQDKLDSFKGSQMPNGTPLNVAYLRMGASGNDDVVEDKNSGLYTFSSDSNDTICSTIFDMASLISGRSTADNVTQVDSKTIRFSSKLPLHSISVLSQQTDARIVSASADGAALDIDRNIALDASEPFGGSTERLYGNAGVLKSGTKVISSGSYTIEFSKDVNLGDLLVQYEPAIGLDLKLERGGTQLEDVSKLITGDQVNISLVPVIAGTDTPIPMEDLPKGISWSIEYIADGQTVDSASGPELNGVEIKPGANIIRGTFQLPGYAPMSIERSFHVVQIVYHLGISAEQPDPLTYLRSDLDAGSEQGGDVIFRITNDGVPISREEVENLGLKLKITSVACDDSLVEGFWNRLGKFQVSCSLRKNDDGSFSLIPKQTLPFTAFLLLAGEYTVDVALSADETVTARGSFTVVPKLSDWIDLGGFLLCVLLMFYLLHLLLKHKFHGETVNYEIYKMLPNGQGLSQNAYDSRKLGLLTGLLWPGRSSRCRFHDLELVAESGRVIIVADKSIARSVYSYGMDSEDPTQRLERIARNMAQVEQEDGTRTAAELPLSGTNEEQRLYFKTSQTDNCIWCIWLS